MSLCIPLHLDLIVWLPCHSHYHPAITKRYQKLNLHLVMCWYKPHQLSFQLTVFHSSLNPIDIQWQYVQNNSIIQLEYKVLNWIERCLFIVVIDSCSIVHFLTLLTTVRQPLHNHTTLYNLRFHSHWVRLCNSADLPLLSEYVRNGWPY